MFLALWLPACTRSPDKPAAAGGPPPGPRPHVVLISLCSVRADHLGCYGYARDTSPHIDGLAARGVLFEHALTPWPKTMPSFCSVMTGLYPHETGVMRTTAVGQRIRDSVETLAERLKKAGYRTAAFTTTPGVAGTTNLQQGFDLYEETWRGPARNRLATASLGLTWLRQNRGHPCLLWVHFNNAHYPYDPAPPLRDRYVDDAHYDASVQLPLQDQDLPIPLPADHPAAMPVRRPDLGGIHKLVWQVEARRAPQRKTQRDLYVARYDACIRSADEQVGVVLDGLAAALGDAPCLVVLWSDHGESLGEHHYFFEHGRFAYDTCIRVPFVLSYAPRWPQARRVSEPVSTVDLAATVCELAGTPRDGLSGMPLGGVIDGKAPRGDVFTCAGYHRDFITAVRRGRHKLMRIPNPLDRTMMQGAFEELYDLQADPGETHNLAAERPMIEEELGAALDAWTRPWWPSATQPAAAASAPADQELRRQLQNIGYLGD
jgi:arylsulfatase